MVKFVLIGGKSKDSNINKIEESIIKMSNKEVPNLLFSPLATINQMDKSINKFKDLTKGLKYNLKIFDNTNLDKFDELLDWADILYIAGGCSDDLVKLFKDYNLDKILIKYLSSNKIYAGSSAGAMLYTKISMGDKYMFSDNFHNYNYKMVDCLGILNISICPHYQNEDLIVYNDELKKYNIDSFGIEEDTALVIDDLKYYVIKDIKSKSLYYFNKDLDFKMIPLYEGEYYEKNSSFRS